MSYYLGFDIGGTKCAAIIGKLEQNTLSILGRRAFPTAETVLPEPTTFRFYQEAEILMTELGISPRELRGVGVSCGSPMSSETGRILSPPNLPGWDDVPITAWLQAHYGISARLQNDANACALAEWRFGAAKGKKNVIFITYGTGCGAGLILDGRLYEGTSGMAGECGHIRLSDFGPVGYGKRGSAEGFCSGGGMYQLGEQLAAEYRQQGKTQIPEHFDVKAMASAARNGDPVAQEVFSIAGEKLGAMLSILIDLFNPEVIVIGSIYARCEDLLAEHCLSVIKREALSCSRRDCVVLPAALGDQIGDYAALSVAVEASEKST